MQEQPPRKRFFGDAGTAMATKAMLICALHVRTSLARSSHERPVYTCRLMFRIFTLIRGTHECHVCTPCTCMLGTTSTCTPGTLCAPRTPSKLLCASHAYASHASFTPRMICTPRRCIHRMMRTSCTRFAGARLARA
eukprot:6172783-Pleurochrysis_carterae.AAC.1